MDKSEALAGLSGKLTEFRVADWNDFPDIELYMDQIIGYLSKQMSLAGEPGEPAMITPSMINNYVKVGHIKRPERKRYDKEHIAALYMLCTLKQSLPITDAAELLASVSPETDTVGRYTKFLDVQKKLLSEVAGRVADADADNAWELALELALEACVCRMTAERLISIMAGKDKKNVKKSSDAKK